jgi:RNA polymerase sigma-70 factor, ECF subfamily
MEETPVQPVTRLLRAWGDGEKAALDELIPLVESELQRLAKLYLMKEQNGHTLQVPDLVNEVYLRLINYDGVSVQNRNQFFGLAAKLMRHVLVDHARSKQYQKRGGGTIIRVSLVHAVSASHPLDADVIALHDALLDLEKFDPVCSQIVELKFFGGLQVDEIAEITGIAPRTIARKWDLARTWLFRELSKK